MSPGKGMLSLAGKERTPAFSGLDVYPPCGFQESWVGNSRTSPTEQLCNLLAQLLE